MAEECRSHGAECLIFAADVADAKAMKLAARATLAHYGELDVWVNNAGVGSLGSFTEIPLEEHRRVIETNLLGFVNGAYLALKIFKRQRYGVLINNASVVSRLATPNLAGYITSKFGVRGLTHALRQDLALEGLTNVHVCQINPGVIDTPAFAHAGNHTGRPVPLKVPMSSPEAVAAKIMRLTTHPKREVFVGFAAALGSLAYTLMPGFTAKVLCLGTKLYYRTAPATGADTTGEIFKA